MFYDKSRRYPGTLPVFGRHGGAWSLHLNTLTRFSTLPLARLNGHGFLLSWMTTRNPPLPGPGLLNTVLRAAVWLTVWTVWCFRPYGWPYDGSCGALVTGRPSTQWKPTKCIDRSERVRIELFKKSLIFSILISINWIQIIFIFIPWALAVATSRCFFSISVIPAGRALGRGPNLVIFGKC